MKAGPSPPDCGSGVSKDHTSHSPFWKQLSSEVLANCYQWLPDNIDHWRFPEARPWLRRFKDQALQWITSLGFYKAPFDYRDRIQEVFLAGDFDGSMQLFADDASRDLLVKLMAFRILGVLTTGCP